MLSQDNIEKLSDALNRSIASFQEVKLIKNKIAGHLKLLEEAEARQREAGTALETLLITFQLKNPASVAEADSESAARGGKGDETSAERAASDQEDGSLGSAVLHKHFENKRKAPK